MENLHPLPIIIGSKFIDGREILIAVDPYGPRPKSFTAANANPYHDELGRFTTKDKAVTVSPKPENLIGKREDLATFAKEEEGAVCWAKNRKRRGFRAGALKCNLFVYELGKAAGMRMPTLSVSGGREDPITAGQWADPGYVTEGWEVIPFSEIAPGDILARTGTRVKFFRECGGIVGVGTGHVGIVVRKNDRLQTASSSTAKGTSPPGKIVVNDFGFRENETDSWIWTARRYTGKHFEHPKQKMFSKVVDKMMKLGY
tara:strand:- start:9254 stop:10027 length:774 start_codon:yes stop_codon:yes gene_type:complete